MHSHIEYPFAKKNLVWYVDGQIAISGSVTGPVFDIDRGMGVDGTVVARDTSAAADIEDQFIVLPWGDKILVHMKEMENIGGTANVILNGGMDATTQDVVIKTIALGSGAVIEDLSNIGFPFVRVSITETSGASTITVKGSARVYPS